MFFGYLFLVIILFVELMKLLMEVFVLGVIFMGLKTNS